MKKLLKAAKRLKNYRNLGSNDNRDIIWRGTGQKVMQERARATNKPEQFHLAQD